MVHIRIKKGLNIPVQGEPRGGVNKLEANGRNFRPKEIALNLSPFFDVRFSLHAKEGDTVNIGQPLVEDKKTPGRMFVSPAGGVIKELRRGIKRQLMNIVINVADTENQVKYPKIDVSHASRQEIVNRLMEGGMFTHIRQRPFNVLANPHLEPRAIFVKAIESIPFSVPAEMQVAGYENDFQTGLTALSKLTSGKVHLVYHKGSSLLAFTEAKDVVRHTAEGPHPIANHSVHIHFIEPIHSAEDVIWTVTARDVVMIGYLLNQGQHLVERIISIGGPGILDGHTGYFSVREGFPIAGLIAGRIPKGVTRFISGDLLMGERVEAEDFLGFYHHGFCAVPENTDREFLSFLRLGVDKYTASGAYLSGHLSNSSRLYDFTTSQHGERRAFIISSPYDKVMPMNIPTMQLVKAVMGEDFDLAEELGLLEVDAEDFALATFCCPSKIEMVGIIKNALRNYAQEVS